MACSSFLSPNRNGVHLSMHTNTILNISTVLNSSSSVCIQRSGLDNATRLVVDQNPKILPNLTDDNGNVPCTEPDNKTNEDDATFYAIATEGSSTLTNLDDESFNLSSLDYDNDPWMDSNQSTMFPTLHIENLHVDNRTKHGTKHGTNHAMQQATKHAAKHAMNHGTKHTTKRFTKHVTKHVTKHTTKHTTKPTMNQATNHRATNHLATSLAASQATNQATTHSTKHATFRGTTHLTKRATYRDSTISKLKRSTYSLGIKRDCVVACIEECGIGCLKHVYEGFAKTKNIPVKSLLEWLDDREIFMDPYFELVYPDAYSRCHFAHDYPRKTE
jgi:hypothetical protein